MTPSTPSPDDLLARLTSPARLAALRATGLLDGASSPVLDRLSRLVARLLGVPVALVSLVDDRGQHFAGLSGLGGWAGEQRGTPLTHSFCQHVVTREEMLLVEDASQHALVANNLAFRELGVVAYAGVPLRTSEGEVLGALCAIDMTPTKWTSEQVATLEDLAAAAMVEIELRATSQALLAAHERLRAQAVRDDLTGLLNRRGFGEQARQHAAAAARSGAPYVIMALDLDGFKEINDRFGHDAGDEALVEMASILLEVSRESDVVARVGGDEFVVLLANTPSDSATIMQERLLSAIAEHNAEPGREYRLATSVGVAVWEASRPLPLAALLRTADDAMYVSKRAGKMERSALSTIAAGADR